MDMAVRVYDSFAEMKADEYRYWQSRPVSERMAAVSELTLAAYSLKGPVSLLPRSEWPFVCLQRGWRSDGGDEPGAQEDDRRG
jgi:hypothetical protein